VKRSTLYRVSLALPIVAPAILWTVPTSSLSAIDPGGNVLGPLVASLPIAGVPYTVFAILMLFFTWKKNSLELRRASLLAPPLFLGFFVAWSAGRGVSHGQPIRSGFPVAMAVLGVFVLAIGYAYVGIVELAMWVGTRSGSVDPAS